MKNLFSEYYKLSEEKIKEIWEDSIIVFDANILLNLYRYTDETRKDFIEVIEKYKDRLWIPYQVAWEYLRNRVSIIIDNGNAYDKLIQQIEEKFNKAVNELSLDAYSHHPYIDVADVKKKIDNCKKTIVSNLQKKRDEYPDYLHDDEILDFVTKNFEGRVGSDCTQKELDEIYKEGDSRYKNKIPPGYCDEKEKKDEGKRRLYGDLIVWKQVIKESSSKKKDVIFVTDDRKDDWWLRKSGKTICPRNELFKEFQDQTGRNILIYNGLSFLNCAKQNKTVKISKKTINEVSAVSKNIEEQQRLGPSIVLDQLRRLWEDSDQIKCFEQLPEFRGYRNNWAKLQDANSGIISYFNSMKNINNLYGYTDWLKHIDDSYGWIKDLKIKDDKIK